MREKNLRKSGIKALTLSPVKMDDIKGVTLDERARLVLLTLGRTQAEIRSAYLRLANRCHPDKAAGDTLRFQVVNEAYEFLSQGRISKKPLLADDELVIQVIGRQLEPLIDRQKEWKEYEHSQRERFYGVGVV